MGNAGFIINPTAMQDIDVRFMADVAIRALLFGGIANMYKCPHAPRGTPSKKRTGRAQVRQQALMHMKYSHGNINGGHQHFQRLFK